MKKNSNLHEAKRAKNDEFYTQFDDVNAELDHYREHFHGKIVYLNCDSAKSAFYQYFVLKFNFLGLKHLVATHFDPTGGAYKLEFDGTTETKTPLKGDGDFRSEECLDILRSCDVVVTNPPFSLFREFVDVLVTFDKKYLIMGNNNAVTYKEIFPLIKDNKMWLGVNSNKTMEFQLAPDYLRWNREDEEGNKFGKVPAISWFTNLEHSKRNEELILYKHYHPEAYQHYDNYDAIDVSKVVDIPMDYLGEVGVPITFLTKYNPDQFEICGLDRYIEGNSTPNKRFFIDGKEVYARIVIKHKNGL